MFVIRIAMNGIGQDEKLNKVYHGSDKRKPAGHKNCCEPREHIDGSVFMVDVPDNNSVIDGHSHEYWACQSCSPATRHYEKVIPLY